MLSRKPVRSIADMNERRADLLLRLMGDGQFRVRRSAYRAMARIDYLMLRNICISWASIRRSAGVRKRAAEASGWLLGDRYPLPIGRLAWDPEPSVRDAFARSQSERRERQYAEEYMEHVLSVREPEDVVPAWRYGEALARMGDDQALEIIEKRVSDSSLHPSIRFWLHRIRENLKKRWDHVVEKWPEPSYYPSGQAGGCEGHVDQWERAGTALRKAICGTLLRRRLPESVHGVDGPTLLRSRTGNTPSRSRGVARLSYLW